MERLQQRGKALYRQLDRRTGGLLGILRDAFESYGEARAAEAAAGMAYYALFSLFPLLLALISAASFFLQSEQISERVVALIAQAIPVSRQLIQRNVEQVLRQRGTVGIVGLIGLLWSASGVFAILVRNIGRVWDETDSRSVVKQRLIALSMVGTLGALLLLSILSTAVLSYLPLLEVPLLGGVSIYRTPFWTAISNFVPWLLIFLLFFFLYRWVPQTDVPLAAALGGALVAAVAWEIASAAFTWLLGSDAIQYELVYGSLGAVVALLFWIYLISSITLFGAHLCGAIAQRL